MYIHISKQVRGCILLKQTVIYIVIVFFDATAKWTVANRSVRVGVVQVDFDKIMKVKVL